VRTQGLSATIRGCQTSSQGRVSRTMAKRQPTQAGDQPELTFTPKKRFMSLSPPGPGPSLTAARGDGSPHRHAGRRPGRKPRALGYGRFSDGNCP
jgi:hypothetical protein